MTAVCWFHMTRICIQMIAIADLFPLNLESLCDSSYCEWQCQNALRDAFTNTTTALELKWKKCLCVIICKPAAVFPHKASSLSGIHVWTILFCHRGSHLYSVCPVFFCIIEQNKEGKIPGASFWLPFVALTKKVALPFKLQKQPSRHK